MAALRLAIVASAPRLSYIARATAPYSAPPRATKARFCHLDDHEPSQRRHHRPRRPRQDHAGRPFAAAIRLVPREPEGRRTGDGFQRPGARARHHHPRQGDLDSLAGHPHQHRRHPRPRRFRRRGRAHPQHGGRRAGAGGRRRRPAAADQVRGVQGAQDGIEAHRRDQQGRSPRRPPGRGGERGVRPVRRARRHRRAARFPDPLRLGQARLDGDEPRRLAGRRHEAAVRSGAAPRQAAHGRGRPVPAARHHPGGQPLSRPHRHRPHQLGLDQAEPGGEGARLRRQAGRDRPRHQGAGLPRPRTRSGRGGGGRRHRRHRRAAGGHRRPHHLRSRRSRCRSTPSRSTRRRWP